MSTELWEATAATARYMRDQLLYIRALMIEKAFEAICCIIHGDKNM